MKKIDTILLATIVLYVVLCYLLDFMSNAEIGDFGGYVYLLVLLSPVVILYTAIWYIILLTKKSVSIAVKAGFLVFLFAIPFVFVIPATNPAFLGMRYLNIKLGGTAKLLEWADKVFQMPIQDVTDEDYAQGGVLDIKEALYKDFFLENMCRHASMLVVDNKKVINLRYPGNGGVLFGDKDLIKKYYDFPIYEDDGLYIWWLPK